VSTSSASAAMPAARNAWSASLSAPYRARELPLALSPDDHERRSEEATGRSAAMRIAAKGRSAGANVARRDAAAKRASSGVEDGEPESGLTA
jgi:hypothetical protein